MIDREFLTTEDIIKEVSKRLGIDENKISYTFDFLFKYIQDLADYEEIVAIKIPHLGTMYAKLQSLKAKKHLYEKREKRFGELSRTEQLRYDTIVSRIKMIEDVIQKDKTEWKAHNKRNKIYNPNLTLKKKLNELEDFQNGEER